MAEFKLPDWRDRMATIFKNGLMMKERQKDEEPG